MKKILIGASALAMMSGAAHAESVATEGAGVKTEVVSAGDRMAADHAPLGVHAGSFLVIPRVDVAETYNDNIYATKSNKQSDMITSVRPEIAARSNWNRHALNAVARGEVRRYADNTDENQENYLVGVDGRLDVLRDTSVGGGVSYAEDHEDRGDPNTLGSPTEPVKYNTTLARIGAYRGLGKANARFDSEVKKLQYANGDSNTGGTTNNSIRDRNEFTQTARLGYQLTDQFEAFVRGAWDNRVYDNKTVARSNNGQTYVVGSTFDVSGKTRGEAYAGGVKRSYANSGRDSISDPVWGGKVVWNATDLTSVIGSIDRGVEETTLVGSSGFLSTDYRAGVEHALTRDILLKANLGYTDNEYKGTLANQREDKVLGAGVGADYWLNRCLKAGVSYNFTDRDSNVTNGGFSRNTLMAHLTATY